MNGPDTPVHVMAHNDTQQHDEVDEIVFIPIEEAARLSGLSRRTIYNKVESGDFPKPVKLSERRIAFVQSEVVSWQRALMEGR